MITEKLERKLLDGLIDIYKKSVEIRTRDELLAISKKIKGNNLANKIHKCALEEYERGHVGEKIARALVEDTQGHFLKQVVILLNTANERGDFKVATPLEIMNDFNG